MASQPGANEFTLSVEFAGICLYVIHRVRKAAPEETPPPPTTHVSVLMPTCLPTPENRVNPNHEDGEAGVRHVPYILMDLANLDPRVPPGLPGDGPQFGIVRRLRREEIVFELETSTGSVIQLDPDPLPLPELNVYDRIGLHPDLFSDKPPVALDVRTILRGGRLVATTIGGSGVGNRGLGRRRNDWNIHSASWAGSIRWERPIPGNTLNIRVRSLDTREDTSPPLTLTARDGRIELKIAILCENNPLEWREFESRIAEVKRDRDFKWLFRLFVATAGGRVLDAIGGRELPYPLVNPRGPRTAGYTGCTGGQFSLP
jgi:hypothetical protein